LSGAGFGGLLEGKDDKEAKSEKANPVDSVFGLKFLKSLSTDKD